MSRKLWLLIALLFILPVSLLSRHRGVGSTPLLQTTSAHPQGVRVATREAALLKKLKSLLEPVGITVDQSSLIDADKVRSVKFLTVKWEAYPEITEEILPAEKLKERRPAKTMRLIESKKQQYSETPMERRRGLHLTTDDLFIAAVDAKSQLRWWEVTRDPRIVVEESLGANNKPNARLYYRSRPEIRISLPDAGDITEIRVFQPIWTGTEFVLEQLATLPFPD